MYTQTQAASSTFRARMAYALLGFGIIVSGCGPDLSKLDGAAAGPADPDDPVSPACIAQFLNPEDVCDCEFTDFDGDGIVDCFDLCPGQNDRLDSNGDGLPDCMSESDIIVLAFLLSDRDGDGMNLLEELSAGRDPNDPTDGSDIDGDGIPNRDDPDVDGDGVENRFDLDIDGDGILNFEDDDMDGDGVSNSFDNDDDGDGLEDHLDDDDDSDGMDDDEAGGCEEDSDCDKGEKCRRDKCFTACTKGGGECDDKEACSNSICMKKCDPTATFSSTPCDSNQQCDKDTSQCVTLCALDDECTSGEKCEKSEGRLPAFFRPGTCKLRCTGDKNCEHGECVASEDDKGKIIKDSDGEVVAKCECEPGWSGDDQCGEISCDMDCGNGNCDGPNACKCDQGWTNKTGDEAACTQPLCFDERGKDMCDGPGEQCDEPGICVNVCADVLDCKPPTDACRLPVCVEGKCGLVRIPDCCLNNDECNVGGPCSLMVCNELRCVESTGRLPGDCCETDEDCNEGNECSPLFCREMQCEEASDAAEGCCRSNDDCPVPGNVCALFECEDFECSFNETANLAGGDQCCKPDDDNGCDDEDVCTDDECVDFECTHEEVETENCCNGPEDCPDDLPDCCDDGVCMLVCP